MLKFSLKGWFDLTGKNFKAFFRQKQRPDWSGLQIVIALAFNGGNPYAIECNGYGLNDDTSVTITCGGFNDPDRKESRGVEFSSNCYTNDFWWQASPSGQFRLDCSFFLNAYNTY